MRKSWALLVAALVLGCGGSGSEGTEEAQAEQSAEDVASADVADPCRLVSQAEMEQFLGPLLQPPYRVTNRQPDPEGTGCLYRAKDYRNITLDVDRESGEMGFRMLAGAGGQIEEALVGTDVGLDTLEANWDRVGRAFGQLIALKGPASVQIDPLGSRLDLGAQVRILSLALGRLDQPLPYNGSAAARKHVSAAVEPRDPCSLVTRAEAEALMGPMRGDPHVAEDGDACLFPLAAEFLGEPVERSLEVQWADGFYALGQERQAMGMAAGLMPQVAGDEDVPSIGENTAGEAEPWDERITLLGGVITVIKRDVLLKIAADGMGGFDEAKALVLLRKAAGRI